MNLKEIYTKGMKSSNIGYIHHTIYRAGSTPLLWLFVKLKIKPNTITVMNIIARIISLYYYLIFSKIPAIVFFQIGLILDYSDGSLARITKTHSEFGRWLDTASDLILRGLFRVFLPIGLFFFYREPSLLIIGMIWFALITGREIIQSYQGGDEALIHSNSKEKIKLKYPFFSRLFAGIINFNEMFFPFIVFFSLNIIFTFYFFMMFIESIIISLEIHSVFSILKRD